MAVIAALLILPAILIFLAQKVPLLDRIGVVPLTFLVGFIIAVFTDLSAFQDIQTTVQEVSVALALPLILFAANIRKAVKDAQGALLAMGLALISVAVISFVGVFLFSDKVDQLPDVAGMAVGAYTGSGINMGAIKTAIDADQDLFLTMITYDIVFSIAYMLVILLFGQRLAGLLLRPYAARENTADAGSSSMEHLADDSAHSYNRILVRGSVPGSLIAFIAAIVVVAASLGLSGLLPENWSGTATILLITTLGMIGAMVPRLHRISTSFHLGMYFILVFCISSATMLDISVFTNMDWSLGAYFGFILVGTVVLHALLCRMFNIDRDTYLIASGAAIMSVPFVPVIAGALKNRELLIPGIAIAIIGYALGNYLGILVATLSAAAFGG